MSTLNVQIIATAEAEVIKGPGENKPPSGKKE